MSDDRKFKWRLYGPVFLDLLSQRESGRGITFVVVVIVLLGVLMVRSLEAHHWRSAAICLLLIVAPVAVGVWLWNRSRKIALEEARQAQSPLNLP